MQDNVEVQKKVIALAGQPNCGKSTIFNMLTGARQYVANYPGVTVEKKYGAFSIEDTKITLVDLPGTYAFTSYSPEERAAREFILHDKPDLVVAVVDAATLDKGIYFLLQLLEMGRPVVVALNMMDIAEGRNLYPRPEELSKELGIPVVGLSATKKAGRTELLEAIYAELHKDHSNYHFDFNYAEIDNFIDAIATEIEKAKLPQVYPSSWLALKMLESDPAVVEYIEENTAEAKHIQAIAYEQSEKIKAELDKNAVAVVTLARHNKARALAKKTLQLDESTGAKQEYKSSMTDKVDAILCHRILGPICLFAILYLFYQISVTYGNELATKIWPLWASFESAVYSILPAEGFLEDPLFTALGSWLVKNITAVLNYIPIFFLMFGFVAILEDSGYLARIAFVLDKIFSTFGLHGQSTLPLILGGIYVGGCAIPGVVATRAIPDERARFATIMIVPMMNCLAKVPLYLLLIGVFFTAEAGSAMFFMGTITMIMGLIVAKILSLTVLRGYPPSPFIIELPSYHMPIAGNVIRETFTRVWIFIRKIVTVVISVAIVVFALINYPNLPADRLAYYEGEQAKLENAFMKQVAQTSWAESITKEDIVPIILYQGQLRVSKRGLTKDEAAKINENALETNPIYASIALRRGDDGKKLATALRRVDSGRKSLRRAIKQERFEGSYLGRAGKALEPLTKAAGFDWRINVALLSALAAKENSAATLGAIYGIDGSTTAESFKESGSNLTPLHALALMLFMALFPPCLPAAMMVRTQTGATKWMIFSILFQITLGICVASFVFSGATALGLTGVEAMWTYYGIALSILLLIGFIPTPMAKPTNILNK